MVFNGFILGYFVFLFSLWGNTNVGSSSGKKAHAAHPGAKQEGVWKAEQTHFIA